MATNPQKKKHGEHFAARRFADYRRAHPSRIELKVMEWLTELGLSYEHEVEIEPGMFADLVLGFDLVIIEVDGLAFHDNARGASLHGEDREARDAYKAERFAKLGYRLIRLAEADIHSGAARAMLENLLVAA